MNDPMGAVINNILSMHQSVQNAQISREAMLRSQENRAHEKAVREQSFLLSTDALGPNDTVTRGSAIARPAGRMTAPTLTAPAPAAAAPSGQFQDPATWRASKMMDEMLPQLTAGGPDAQAIISSMLPGSVSGQMPAEPERIVSYNGKRRYQPTRGDVANEQMDAVLRRVGAQTAGQMGVAQVRAELANENAMRKYQMQHANAAPVNLPGIGNVNLSPGDFGGAATLINQLLPNYKLVQDYSTGTPTMIGVDPRTNAPLTVRSPDWKGASSPRPRAAAKTKSAAGDKPAKLTPPQLTEALANKVLQDSANGGGTTIEHAVKNLDSAYQNDPSFNTLMRSSVKRKLLDLSRKDSQNPFVTEKPAAKPAQASTSNTEPQVRIKTPDGRVGTIPQSRLEDAKKHGAMVL